MRESIIQILAQGDRLSAGEIAAKLQCSASDLILLLLDMSDRREINRHAKHDKMYFSL
jgi:hypothetical protein